MLDCKEKHQQLLGCQVSIFELSVPLKGKKPKNWILHIQWELKKNDILKFETLKGLNSPKIETRPPKLFCCFVLQSNKMSLLSQTVYKAKSRKKN